MKAVQMTGGRRCRSLTARRLQACQYAMALEFTNFTPKCTMPFSPSPTKTSPTSQNRPSGGRSAATKLAIHD
ncbi:hypothetical protein JG687_00016705 [Phytophthora cactorum]|uniref:Uncharacterized protein n=1 Tax=Phytophthora cactorum TaxID=29920 RepID=A0A8T1TTE3_9STRA|nr:hypothetical protein JG687_00016705 [Phytophthora cactorum]